jgi:hypothetical protein
MSGRQPDHLPDIAIADFFPGEALLAPRFHWPPMNAD